MSSTRASKQLRDDEDAEVSREFENLIRRELELIGEDPERDGLARTPSRVAKSLRFLTQGYDTSAEEVVGKGVFSEEGQTAGFILNTRRNLYKRVSKMVW